MSSAKCNANIMAAVAKAAIKQCGGNQAVAKACNVEEVTVRQWQRRGVSTRHVLRLSEMSGVPPQVLRPDLYETV